MLYQKSAYTPVQNLTTVLTASLGKTSSLYVTTGHTIQQSWHNWPLHNRFPRQKWYWLLPTWICAKNAPTQLPMMATRTRATMSYVSTPFFLPPIPTKHVRQTTQRCHHVILYNYCFSLQLIRIPKTMLMQFLSIKYQNVSLRREIRITLIMMNT